MYVGEREEKKALDLGKGKASNVSVVFFQVDAKALVWERKKELWLKFRLSPTNLCWVGRLQDNALWLCHVCIRAFTAKLARRPLSLSLSHT